MPSPRVEAHVETVTPGQMRDDLEEYWRLIHTFPLTPIRDDTHLEQALTLIDQLIEHPRHDTGAQEYLGALADLVYVYEQQHVTWPRLRGLT
jgi:hypothetical protein